jgi:iron complex transport system permease protein
MPTTRPLLFSGLILLALFSLLFALTQGSSAIQFTQLFHSELAYEIIFNLRLPRILCAFVTGGLLSLAGALMQVLLRNPLADPYVLGTSGGAAVALLVGILFGMSGLALTGSAWLGSAIAISMIFALSQKNHWNPEHLILIGIALASGFSAIISLILLLSPDHILRGMLFWLTGDLSEARIPLFEIIILVLGFIFSFFLADKLNILIRGEQQAAALGIDVNRLKIKLFLLSAILTATAVTLAGCIGFIGLIIPHLFRLLFGYDHRILLPGCILLGGSFLTLADTFARTVFAPQQLPVGIVMALIGIPIFLFLLQKKS